MAKTAVGRASRPQVHERRNPACSIRGRYTLTAEEREAFFDLKRRQFHADAAAVWRFWKVVAEDRCLDYATIMTDAGDGTAFTALPLGHHKHWCWPAALIVKPVGNLQNVAFA